jgi:transcription elongation factor GreA-like protein
MSAKTYDEEQDFDMEDKFHRLLRELEEIKYDTISSSLILSVISLILSKNKECKRKVILQLDKQAIINIWEDVISALKESIDYFRSVYRIPVSALLPYDSLLVPFSYFFYHNKEKPK